MTRQVDEQIAKFNAARKAYEEDLRRARDFSAAHSTSAGSSAASVTFQPELEGLPAEEEGE
eukprot:12411781-Alexandrium_andersonii.AAC.1